jgi:hypothetical protein
MSTCVLSGHANTDQISDDYTYLRKSYLLTFSIRNLNDFSSIFEYILLTHISIFAQWHDLHNLLFYLTLFLSVEVSGEEEYATEKSQA